MLPSHSQGPYGAFAGSGGRRGRGSAGPSPVIIYGVLITLLCLLGFAHLRSSRLNSKLQAEVHEKQTLITSLEDQLNHKRSTYSHMEYQFHSSQRRVSEVTVELGQIKTQLAECTQQSADCQQNQAQVQDELKEAQEKLAYELAVVEAHKFKVEQLEKAHMQREADWHALSQKWAKFEEDAVKENLRLLGELQKLQAAAATPASAAVPSPPPAPTPEQLPDQEPKVRPETEFNTRVELPKEEEYVHHHAQRAAGIRRAPVPSPQQDPTPVPTRDPAAVPQQQQQQQQQQQGAGVVPPREAPAVPRQLQDTPATAQQGAAGTQQATPQATQQATPQATQQAAGVPSPAHGAGAQAAGQHGAADINGHPAPQHHEHDHIYDNDHGWDMDHIDPLDHYWMDDHFDAHHDSFHGEHWQDPHGNHYNTHPNDVPSHHTQHDSHHAQHDTHGHVEDWHDAGHHDAGHHDDVWRDPPGHHEDDWKHGHEDDWHTRQGHYATGQGQYQDHGAGHAQEQHQEAAQQGPGGTVQVPVGRQGAAAGGARGRPDPKLIPRHDRYGRHRA